MHKRLILPALFIYLAFLFTLPAFAQNDAKIIYLKGQVKLQRAMQPHWIVAEEGMAIKKGDRIKTFKFSAVEIALDRDAKNVIRVEQNSEFLLDKIAERKTTLPQGKVFALLEGLKPGSSFEVRTPTAVCGVAGSGIFVDTDGNRTTAGCHENQAYAKGIKEDGSLTPEKIIKEGYKSIIEKFKAPGPLIALTAQEQKEWTDFKEGLKEHLEWLKAGKGKDSKKIIDRIEKLQDRADKKAEIQRDDRQEKREQEKREEAGGQGPTN